jgi:hypothetical protein
MKRLPLVGSDRDLLVCAVLVLCLGATLEKVGADVLLAPTVVNSATPFSAAFPASNAVDQTQLDYASQGQAEDTFLEFSFGTLQTFDRIIVINRDSSNASDYIGNYTLTLDAGVSTQSVFRTPLRGTGQIDSLGTRTATNVRLDVDTIGAGTTRNTGVMEVIFLNTPAGRTPILGASVIASATPFNATFDASNALDGDVGRVTGATNSTDYASQGLGAAAFIDFDLGAQLPVGGFDWIDRIHPADRVLGFDMIFSPNSTFGDGDDVVRSYDNSVTTRVALGDSFAPISARYVRYDVSSSSGLNTGANEFIFYQVQVPEPSAVTLVAVGLLGFSNRRSRAS